MTEREFFVEKMNEELGAFERVFRALPEDKLHHTHHPRSKTAEGLFLQMVEEAESFNDFLVDGKVDWSSKGDRFTTTEEMVDRFSVGFKNARDLVSEMSDEAWNQEAVASMGGKEIWKTTKAKMAWGLLFDLVHHRGQLSTYIRPMGGKVPSIYGPSADTLGI